MSIVAGHRISVSPQRSQGLPPEALTIWAAANAWDCAAELAVALTLTPEAMKPLSSELQSCPMAMALLMLMISNNDAMRSTLIEVSP
jgi:hypothetical protein